MLRSAEMFSTAEVKAVGEVAYFRSGAATCVVLHILVGLLHAGFIKLQGGEHVDTEPLSKATVSIGINDSKPDLRAKFLSSRNPVGLHLSAVMTPWSAKLEHPDIRAVLNLFVEIVLVDMFTMSIYFLFSHIRRFNLYIFSVIVFVETVHMSG